jgi:hypothetical protein
VADYIIDNAGDDSRAKGSARYFKHARQTNDFDIGADTGHGVQAASGEEEVGQDELLERGGLNRNLEVYSDSSRKCSSKPISQVSSHGRAPCCNF